MTHRVAEVLALVFLSFASPALAQYPGAEPPAADPSHFIKGACTNCGARTAIDWISNIQVDPKGTRKLVMAGWGFECVSGQPADRVDTFAYDPARDAYVPVHTEIAWKKIPRPDVATAFMAECPNVTQASGFGAVILGRIPDGSTRLIVNVWKGPYYRQSTIPIILLR